MATFRKFEEIEAWQEARILTNKIYDITSNQPFCKDYGLCDQIRRAAISVMSNISEGYERSGSKEFKQFLYIAKGSVGEIRSQLYVALDRNYINQDIFNDVNDYANKVARIIAGLIKYLRNSEIKGEKYKNT